MKNVLISAFICLAICSNTQAQTLTKIYVLRHADRTPVGDDLSVLGLKRASDLKRYLLPTNIKALFSTNTVRTRKTVQPMVTPLMPVQIYEPIPALLTKIKTNFNGKRVVVVGHSNTVPQIITACGCVSPFPAIGIPDNQFDNLLLLLVRFNPIGAPTCELLHTKYGDKTPL